MKKLTIFLLIVMVFAFIIPQTDAESNKQPLHIKSITMRFDETDAIVTVDFDFPALTKMYLLLLGSKNIEPEIESVFSNFDYKITKMNQDKAELKIKNISRFDKGYYLHDSFEFGSSLKTIYIYTPDSQRRREYNNLNSTPPIFYRG